MPDLDAFCERYDIRAMTFSEDAGISGAEASRVTIRFRTGRSDAPEWCASFKLLDEAADVHRLVRAIGPGPDRAPELTGAGRDLGDEQLGAVLEQLLAALEPRVGKVHREQSILNTQPVGQTFMLAGKTRFEVLADDGTGRLTISLKRPEGDKEASLAANDLLDGLYTGLISRA